MQINAPYTDESALREFLDQVDVVTTEFENIPDACLATVEAARPLRPSRHAIYTTQHRQREKLFLREEGIPCAEFEIINNLAELEKAVQKLGRPCVIKTAAFGYDGKGQCKVNADTDLATAWQPFASQTAVVEAWVPFRMEVSVVGARDVHGRTAIHGCVENTHDRHILDVTISPARISQSLRKRAEALWQAVARGLDFIGTMAVELFITAEDEVLVNEIAPRPHNSGHYTIDACFTNQFQQQQRAVAGLPLGDASQHCPAAVMVNLLGDVWPTETEAPDWSPVLNHPRAKLHLYGKEVAKLRRKMGHFTLVGQDVETLLAEARHIQAQLGSSQKRPQP
jgi:5-(carboxyamino)imidazole ribonucleotide synthase